MCTGKEVGEGRSLEELPEHLLGVAERKEPEAAVEFVVVPTTRSCATVNQTLFSVLIVHAPFLVCNQKQLAIYRSRISTTF